MRLKLSEPYSKTGIVALIDTAVKLHEVKRKAKKHPPCHYTMRLPAEKLRIRNDNAFGVFWDEVGSVAALPPLTLIKT